MYRLASILSFIATLHLTAVTAKYSVVYLFCNNTACTVQHAEESPCAEDNTKRVCCEEQNGYACCCDDANASNCQTVIHAASYSLHALHPLHTSLIKSPDHIQFYDIAHLTSEAASHASATLLHHFSHNSYLVAQDKTILFCTLLI